VQAVLDRRYDAEVAATAAQPPKQVRILVLGGADEMAVRGHDIEGEGVVARQAESTAEPTKAAAERQTGRPCMGDDARGRGEAECRAFVVELA
jgi:hypothetical protein